jgi:hypothetical protein
MQSKSVSRGCRIYSTVPVATYLSLPGDVGWYCVVLLLVDGELLMRSERLYCGWACLFDVSCQAFAIPPPHKTA